MKKNLFLISLLTIAATFNAKAQKTIFYDSFESYEDFSFSNMGDWTLIDADAEQQTGIGGVSFPNNGASFAYMVMNSSAVVPVLNEINTDRRNFLAKTGNKAAASFASLTPSNNDWLISPKIQLDEEENQLSFSAKVTDNVWKYEKFRVLISTTDTDIASFTALPQIYDGTYFTSTEWQEFIVNLDNYKGQEVYIAINCISSFYDNPQAPTHLQKRSFVFLIDDFKVTSKALLSATEAPNSSISIYPNPVRDIVNISHSKEIKNVKLFDISGKLVATKFLGNKFDKINMSYLKPGIYILKAKVDGSDKTFKIEKK